MMAVASLVLGSDAKITDPSLQEFLKAAAGTDQQSLALAELVLRIAQAGIPLSRRLAQGRLPGDPAARIGENSSGDAQKALDLGAHQHFLALFRDLPVAKVLSEEADAVVELDPDGLFDIAMDPIDGSGSIGIGAPLGALFCIFPRGESFLRPGRQAIAAAYLSFGHSVDFGFSLGDGVSIATLDPVSGQFHVGIPRAVLAPDSATIAFNASNQRHWPVGLQRYVADLLHGAEGPRARDFNMRWIAAAVGDLNRILHKGGVFFYPADRRPGYENGVLRLCYEASPIAFLIEQAGGAATDGAIPILDMIPDHPHQRVPLYFGARAEVATLGDYLSQTGHQEP